MRTLAHSLTLALLTAAAVAQELPHAFVGGRVLAVSGPPIEDGVVIVQFGRIRAVGARTSVELPSGAKVVDVKGKVLMPGLVDTHSHVGGGWGADSSAPIQPDVRMLDAINCRDAGLQRAQAGGITTINVMSGSGHLMSGQTIYVKNRDARTIEEQCYRFPDGTPMGGMKMANGTNSQQDPPFPGTRGKSAALVRERFLAAQEYKRKLDAAALDATKLPSRDLGHEALLEILSGKRIVHHHTHRHDDIVTVLRLAKEFGFRVVLHHVSEAWKVAEEIAAANVACSLIVLDTPGGKLEAMDFDARSAAELERLGRADLVGFHTDDWITDSRLFLRSAALAVRAGVSRETALAGLTLNAARMLDLHERVGSLEPGKDADFLVLSGDPFSTYTRVEQTWVEGSKVFDLSNEHDRLWAEGGWGAGLARAGALCCVGEAVK
ncbi:MAG: amidohydrolase family protein [Planctomycetes bacterium]|nr:amidohydrolase family protein [Planctomycetota bacterium]